MGYDKDVFISRELADKFVCAVCRGVAKDVFETDCGHIFCRLCVERLIRKTTTSDSLATCPHCRASVSWQNVHASKFLNREISNLQCKCNLCNTWTGNLSKLHTHQLSECPDQFVDCEWKKWGCKHYKIKRKDIEAHNQEFKVQHLEFKIKSIQSVHQTQISTLKRKHEQQINQLNQKLADLETKWKQKCYEIAKKYTDDNNNNNNKNNINIQHIENINISNSHSSSTTNTSNNSHQHQHVSHPPLQQHSHNVSTPVVVSRNSTLHNIQVQKSNDSHTSIQYNSDGSISYDPNSPLIAQPQHMSASTTTVSSKTQRGRKKRKRSAVDEVVSASDEHSNDEHSKNVSILTSMDVANGSSNGHKMKRSQKRRRMDGSTPSNRSSAQSNHNNGGNVLNSLLWSDSMASKKETRSSRKKKTNRSQAGKKRQSTRRMEMSDEENEHLDSSHSVSSDFEES